MSAIYWTAGWAQLRALPPSNYLPLVVLPMLFVVGFAAFLIRCALVGVPRDPRIAKLAQSRLVPRLILEYGYWFLPLPVKLLVALRVSADAITLLSLAAAGGGAWYVGQGEFAVGGWLLYLAFILDALDGMVARATGTSSDRGEFFDSFIDRYADFVIFLGFMWYYRADPLPLALAALGMIGSSVMGYARAKGESVGIDPNVGWMQRHERAVIVGSLTVLAPVLSAFVEPGAAHPRFPLTIFALGLVALFTNLAALQRAHYVMSRMARPGAPAPATDEPSGEPLSDEVHAS